MENLAVSISHTTRAKRPGEIQDKDYHFVSEDEFTALLQAGAFLESALVFNHHYGTSIAAVEQHLQRGQDVMLEIDWQGAQQLSKLFPNSIKIFILPPSRAALEQRLVNREQDHKEVIAGRMQEACKEISHFVEYDYIVVNDDFAHTVAEMTAIITASRLRLAPQALKLKQLIADLLE
jgi:guanylate kinase